MKERYFRPTFVVCATKKWHKTVSKMMWVIVSGHLLWNDKRLIDLYQKIWTLPFLNNLIIIYSYQILSLALQQIIPHIRFRYSPKDYLLNALLVAAGGLLKWTCCGQWSIFINSFHLTSRIPQEDHLLVPSRNRRIRESSPLALMSNILKRMWRHFGWGIHLVRTV